MTIKEAKNKLIEVINSSGLSIDVMDLLIENIYSTVHREMELAYARASEEANEEHTEEAPNTSENKKGVKKNVSK